MQTPKQIPWYRNITIWLSLKLNSLGMFLDDMCCKLALNLFWFGAAKQRAEYEAARAKLQAELAEALVEALGPGTEIQGKVPGGGTVRWTKPPGKTEYKS